MNALNNFIVEDFKNHLISTAEYVKSMHEEDEDFTSVNDRISQVWEIAVDTFEGDNIEWGSEKEDQYGVVFDDIEDFIHDIVA